ncbi:MAG: T9SS type A sorting domain-containing protein [Saprospiraceae bacterium]|nr:T9SS type A sorting domain-containing protein [Saprospiraceae bacterium]MCF8250113.1 T9SS type A sorting domain-containing protein [Saprospiraceae bacterium]MCF8279377.1 T9SS type A sorting domain-containing protein [Bacteroidales bacterium]MCF8440452.1 T9SS type A sorting domain-containing protein [Saprospiraceae bacterium]
MNYLFYTKKIFLFLLAICWFSNVGLGQTPTIQVFHEVILKNSTFTHSFDHWSAGVPPEIDYESSNGDASHFNPSSCCQGNKGVKGYPMANNFIYQPDNDFLGRDTVIVQYSLPFGNFQSQDAWKIFYFTVVPSFLQANDDYVATMEGQSVEIAVLTNDIGNGTDQAIAEITNINNGTAERSSNNTKILFTPAAGFKGIANLNYSICDAQGSCSFAVVNICVNPTNPPTHDTLVITTNKNVPEVVMVDIDGSYTVGVPPAHGILDTLQTLVYIPNQNYTGSDEIVFENSNGYTRTVIIKVVNVPRVSTILNNDLVYTSKNEVIEEIHLLDNDNGGPYFQAVNAIGYPATAKGGTLDYLWQQGKGVYKYTPPAGFTGIDKFKYRAMAPNSPYDTATCYIVVNDLNPVVAVFHMTTPKNTPLVLGDHLPLEAYTYQSFSIPDRGDLTFLPGYDTYTSGHGQTFSGKNMLVYDPGTGETGSDEFEFEYCADGLPNGCQLVKVELEIIEIANPQSDTLCAGRECVWAGDANRDGAVNVLDVLPVGMCMGEVGLTRTDGTTEWYGQYANNWNSFFATGLGFDVKYLDTDGNGIVSNADTTAIGLNYGSYHNLTPGPIEALENLPFYIEEPNFPQNLEIGDVFYAPVVLGTNNIPAVNAYGLAFELLYDPAIFDVNIIFNDNAWMDYNSPILSMTKKPLPGKIDAAYTRTSGLAASGFGNIGVAEFIVIDDVNGNRPNKFYTQIQLNGLGLMNGSGQVAGLSGNTIEVAFGGDSKELKPVTEDQLVVFPNPASQRVTLHLNGLGHEMERVMLYNLTGGLVYDSGKMTAKRMMLDVAGLSPGMYVVKVLANGKVLNKKVEVIR